MKPACESASPRESCPFTTPCWPSYEENRTWSEISFPLKKAPGFSRTRVQHSPGSWTIELPSVLAESLAHLLDCACHGTLARAAAPYQAFRDNSICLSRAALPPKGAPNWSSEETHLVNTIFNQPNRMNQEDNQLAAPLLRMIPALHSSKRPSHAHTSKPFFFGGRYDRSSTT